MCVKVVSCVGLEAVKHAAGREGGAGVGVGGGVGEWVWYGMVWFGLVWFGLVWFGLVWFGLDLVGLGWLIRWLVWFGLGRGGWEGGAGGCSVLVGLCTG